MAPESFPVRQCFGPVASAPPRGGFGISRGAALLLCGSDRHITEQYVAGARPGAFYILKRLIASALFKVAQALGAKRGDVDCAGYK